MKKILLLIHTLKYLKWPQFYFRLYRKFAKPRVGEEFSGVVPKRNSLWVHTALYSEKITTDLEATFLNSSKKLRFPSDWNNENHSKLWVYNLHYFEDLLAVGADQKYALHIRLINLWMDGNPVGEGNGWEPYPLSLRIPNMLKAWQAGLPLDGSHFSSLYAQASYLSTDLEKHLLGNHYFVNLKALLFAGIIFQNSRWLGLAVTGLVKEIPEQTLPDGANFELTPMYHSLILVDMLDMFNLCRAYPSEQTSKLTLLLETYIPKMLKFMQLMSHNDGGVSFFNDSVDGIAPPKARIESYARALGFRVHKLDTMQTSAIDSMPSGYMCAMSNGNKLIFDAANVGPDYIPGHAHADTLSFELSLGPQRVFVNTGTSQYGLGEKRLVERRTQSHNTVEVDGFDSSQVWSGFRVAKRARVISRSHRVIDDRAVLSASHNGFKKVSGGPIHFRQLELSENSLKVVDAFNGEYGTAVARFYLHPSLKAAINSECLTIIGENFEIKADLKNLQAQLSDTTWHPGFGLSQPNKCLELRFTAEEQSVEFTWKTT